MLIGKRDWKLNPCKEHICGCVYHIIKTTDGTGPVHACKLIVNTVRTNVKV